MITACARCGHTKSNAWQFTITLFLGLTWPGAAPRTAVALSIPCSLMIIVFYALLNKETFLSSCKGSVLKHQDIKYKELKEQEPKQTSLLFKLFKTWPFASLGYAGNFALQLSMTSILTTITFINSPFTPRDHYQYYRIVNVCGYVFGGAVPVLCPYLFLKWGKLPKVLSLWVPICLNASCMMLYLLESWYRFLPNVYILLGLVIIQGIAQGYVCVNSVGQSASVFTDAEDKAMAMVIVSGSLSVGRLLAGFLGLFVERYLRDHCTNNLLLGRFCLARRPSFRGWTSSGG